MVMPKVLIVSIRNSDFSEMLRFARCLRHSLKFEPVILDLNHNYAEICDHKYIVDQEGIRFITPTLRQLVIKRLRHRPDKRDLPPNVGQTNAEKQVNRTLIRHLKSKFRSLLGIPFLFLISTLDFSNILKRNLPELIVLPEDIVGVDTPLIIKLAQTKNIPSFILPYTIANHTEAVEALKDLAPYNSKSFISKIVKKLFPSWHFSDSTVSLLRLPIAYIVCHELFRLTPPNPWMMNSGYANQIAIESSKMYEFYLKEGFLRDRLTLTGSLADDLQYTRLTDQERLKNELCKELAIDQTKPIILVAAPPNQLASGDRRGFEFDSFTTSLKAVFPSTRQP